MLAMALGTLLALFSLHEAVVLPPSPIPERIVWLGMQRFAPDGSRYPEPPSPEELKEAGALPWLEQGPVQQDVRYLRLDAAGTTRSALVAFASPDFFSALGILPAIGRLFSAQDPEPGAVLSWAAWKHLGGSLPLGAPVTVDGVSLPFLGVLPEGFSGFTPGIEPEAWVTLEARRRSGALEAKFLTNRDIGIPTFGRLRPGLTPAQAQLALKPLVDAWARLRGPELQGMRPWVRPVGDLRREAWKTFLPGAPLLWAGSILLVLMAALNLGNLQVARWIKERRDVSTRVALGASPARLVGVLGGPMVATLLLGTVGALPLAWALGLLIARFPAPSEFPLHLDLRLHWPVFALALGVVVLMAAGMMLLAWVWFLRHVSHGGHAVLGGVRWRKGLLGLQFALSSMLLFGTLNSLGALWKARSTPLGLDPRGVQAYSFAFPTHILGGRKAKAEAWTRLDQRFKTIPGSQASCVFIPPCEAFDPPPRSFQNSAGQMVRCRVQRVHPGVFDLLRIPILQGRDFSAADTQEAPRTALVNAPMAERLWPGQSALGQVLHDEDDLPVQVIGVVADHRWEGLAAPIPHLPLVFLCGQQQYSPLLTLLMRSQLPMTELDALVEREVAQIDPRLAIQRAEPLASRVDRMLQPQRLAATLFGMMGASALALSFLGLFALQQYLTLQRLQEAGLRMALGATPDRVRRGFLANLRWPLGLGLLAGAGGTILGWKVLGAAWTGLPPLSLPMLACVLAGLVLIALLAAVLPLRRLDRSTPSDLLRAAGD
jgi:predicted permease